MILARSTMPITDLQREPERAERAGASRAASCIKSLTPIPQRITTWPSPLCTEHLHLVLHPQHSIPPHRKVATPMAAIAGVLCKFLTTTLTLSRSQP